MSAEHFVPRILMRQLLVGGVAFVAIGLLARALLGIDAELIVPTGWALARLGLVSMAVVLGVCALRLRAHRFLLRSLALDSRAVEPEELGALGRLPSVLTAYFFGVTATASLGLFIDGVRPERLDAARTISLIILSITILGTASITHYVLLRRATMAVIATGAPEIVSALLELLEARGEPPRRVMQKLLLATTVPVALTGAAAVLITHAHIRIFIEQGRRESAELVARAAFEPLPAAMGDAGRRAAFAQAKKLGFRTRILSGSQATRSSWVREPDGQLTVSVPLDDGVAQVRLAAGLELSEAYSGAAVTLLALVVAALLGGLTGRILARDLRLATESVQRIGTEATLQGTTRVATHARFDVVRGLAGAIEDLTERFGIFAAAQERRLGASDAAQRARSLLFASMSHDLKSPLNAVLGFADLLLTEPMTGAQVESLSLISTRGRELLALIETILDAARVEAGQLSLSRQPTPVSALVEAAVSKAHELVVDTEARIAIDVPASLPFPLVDPAYLPRALAVIVAHALRSASEQGHVAVIRASCPDGVRVRILVGHRPGFVEAERPAHRPRPASHARFLTLGSSLARSVIELHGGSIEVGPSRDVLACVWLPLAPPSEAIVHTSAEDRPSPCEPG